MIYFYPISKIGYIWEVSLLIKKVKTISNISYQPLFGWGLFIFGFLYFCCLGFHEPVWYDEGITLFHTNKSFHELIEFSKVDNNPPLFNILLYGWSKIFGYSILASRALSAIFMSITMVLIHSLGKKIYGSCYAIISVAFLFSFEAIIYYSVEIRSYGLMLMLAMCNLYALYTIYHKNNLLNSAMWVVSLVLLFFTHYAAGIFMSGSFLMILKDISDGSFWLKSPDWNMVQKSLTQFTEIFGLNFFFYFFILISGILIPILYVKDRRKNKKLLMFVSFLILLPGLSFVVSQSVPMFGFRYLLFLIPIFTITVFLILSYFPKKIGLGICAILFILSLRSTDVIYSRPDYNSLREMVLDQIKEDHAIIINESREALPYLINQNGNIFRSDVEFNLKCEDASIIRTSVKKFGEYSDLTYLVGAWKQLKRNL